MSRLGAPGPHSVARPAGVHSADSALRFEQQPELDDELLQLILRPVRRGEESNPALRTKLGPLALQWCLRVGPVDYHPGGK